jgi:hypothetical protein
MKLKLKNFSWNWRRILLIGGALTLVVLGAYSATSVWTWSTYKSSYSSWKKDVKSKFDTTMSMPTGTSDQKTKWLAALDSTASIVSQQNRCNVGVFYNWQTVIPALKSDMTDCKNVQSAMDTLYSSLSAAIKSIRAEVTIASILAEPLKSTSVSDTAYSVEIEAWTKAQASLSSVDAPNEIAGVKTAAISASLAIKTAWNALMTANTAQNASQYQNALNGLSQAYEGLNNVSSESGKALQKVGETLQKSYDAVF